MTTEPLPPDSVEGIILLAPSVSAGYDIRPALRCSRRGVEVFHSRRDFSHLTVAMFVLGTSDRKRGSVAGKVGFRLPETASAEDASLYSRLHQHAWHEGLLSTGHDGGHFGTYQPDFMRSFVLPLIVPPPETQLSARP